MRFDSALASMIDQLGAVRGSVIVDPHYDAKTIHYGADPNLPVVELVIPDSAKNPLSQQGPVVAVSPYEKDIEVGDWILFHPFIAYPFWHNEHEYLKVKCHDIVGWLSPDGELFPLPDHVMVAPDHSTNRPKTSAAGLYIPQGVFTVAPPQQGTVIRRGERVTTVNQGQVVVYPDGTGAEVGLVDRVYYTIKAEDLLAILA